MTVENLIEVENHVKENHQDENGRFECKNCHKTFKQKQNIKWHNEAVHEGKRFPCSECKKIIFQIQMGTQF